MKGLLLGCCLALTAAASASEKAKILISRKLKGATETVDCSGVTATTWSGASTTCDGAKSTHWWPVDPNPAVTNAKCHGWSAIDDNGKMHDNSATNIRFSSDCTTLLYDQYAGSIDCDASIRPAVAKSFTKGECHQGIRELPLFHFGFCFSYS